MADHLVQNATAGIGRLLSHLDPAFYPPTLELLRFELMLGTLPPLILAAYQISAWRNRLAQQRRELRETLEKVQELASRDALTGLYNRRHMQDKLADSMKRYERYGERFTIVLVDLDRSASYDLRCTDLEELDESSVVDGGDLVTAGLEWPLTEPLTARIWEISRRS